MKKVKRLALKSVFSSKVLENELTVVDKLELKEIKTKAMVKAFADLKIEGKTLVILPEKNLNVQSFILKNNEEIKLITFKETLNNIKYTIII